MKTILFLSIGLVWIWSASGQNDGRYRGIFPITTRRRPSIFPTVRPRPVADGRYRAPADGRYRPSGDGRYRGGNDGRYVHVDNPGGAYSGDAGRYVGSRDGSGGASPSGLGATRASGLGVTRPSGLGVARPSGVLPTRRPASAVQILTPAVARPSIQGKGTAEGGGNWRIIRDENTVDAEGYHWLYETENGITGEEQGRIESLDRGEEGLRSTGFYEYTGDDGLLYRVDYVADNNGFVPQGEHIPKVPPHVVKLLAYLAANAPNNRR